MTIESDSGFFGRFTDRFMSLPTRSKLWIGAAIGLIEVAFGFLVANVEMSETWQENVRDAQAFLLIMFILVVVPFDTRESGSDKSSRVQKIISYVLLIGFIILGGLLLLSIIAGAMGIPQDVF